MFIRYSCFCLICVHVFPFPKQCGLFLDILIPSPYVDQLWSKSEQEKIPEKLDPENPVKIRISNFCYFGSDFKNGYYKKLFYGVEMKFFFVIYTNYYIFEVTIFSPICTNSKNFRQICTFLLFGINISQ